MKMVIFSLQLHQERSSQHYNSYYFRFSSSSCLFVVWISVMIFCTKTEVASCWLLPSSSSTTTRRFFKASTSTRKQKRRSFSIASRSHMAHNLNPALERSEEKEQQHRHKEHNINKNSNPSLYKLQGKLLKKMRNVCKDYNMIEDGDHIMVCVSGGKDSATLLYLFLLFQKKLLQSNVRFRITAVHVDQKQPGYNGTPLVDWLQHSLQVPYRIVEEDTYSIVIDKTPSQKSFCTICSRLRRGILYSTAVDLGCNKIALGHHADDTIETLLLNMLHSGKMKGMPARYTSFARSGDGIATDHRDTTTNNSDNNNNNELAILRPLITCMEKDIQEFAKQMGFPILPCNLCSNQAQTRTKLHRPSIKKLLKSLEFLNPKAKQNMVNAMQDIRPSHLLDQSLRQSCGMDPVKGYYDDDDHEDIDRI